MREPGILCSLKRAVYGGFHKRGRSVCTDPLGVYSVLSSLPLKGRSAKRVTGQTALAHPCARARQELYHHVAFQHLQPWGPVGLQQSVHHVLELVLLLSRNAIPGLLGNKAEAESRHGPSARKHVLGASCVPRREPSWHRPGTRAQARDAGTGPGRSLRCRRAEAEARRRDPVLGRQVDLAG